MKEAGKTKAHQITVPIGAGDESRDGEKYQVSRAKKGGGGGTRHDVQKTIVERARTQGEKKAGTLKGGNK